MATQVCAGHLEDSKVQGDSCLKHRLNLPKKHIFKENVTLPKNLLFFCLPPPTVSIEN